MEIQEQIVKYVFPNIFQKMLDYTLACRYFTCANLMETLTLFCVPMEPFSTNNTSFVTGGTTLIAQPQLISML